MSAQASPIVAYLDESDRGTLSICPIAHQHDQIAHESRISLTYFAEGAANVLFSVAIIRPTQLTSDELSWAQSLVRGNLLRLRKGDEDTSLTHSATGLGIAKGAAKSVPPPPFVSVRQINDFITNHIANVIPTAHIVKHTLVHVHPAVIAQCNALLSELDKFGLRHPKRRGWHIVASDPYAFLVTDMSAHDQTSLMIEFKPKWLAQSPAAGSHARRCRTCAWHHYHGLPTNKRYCPLALASRDPSLVKPQVATFMPARNLLPAGWDMNHTLDLIVEYLCDETRGYGLMHALRKLQIEWDPRGANAFLQSGKDPDRGTCDDPDHLLPPLDPASSTDDALDRLSWAMTLRDCIVFIRLQKNPISGQVHVQGKIADLDLKKVDVVKLEKWATDESVLKTGGFYSATDGENSIQDDPVCLLSTSEGRCLYERVTE